MYSLKPGRGPSLLNGLSGIIFCTVAFGMSFAVCAIGNAFTNSIPNSAPAVGPFKNVFACFALVPLLIGVVGLINVIYSFYNATAKNRLSNLDITTHTEEPDPLNPKPTPPTNPATSPSTFCTNCGSALQPTWRFCARCGTSTPTPPHLPNNSAPESN